MDEIKTIQQAFDVATAGVLRQGRVSMMPGMCMFRGKDGCKCAIGWLIPDDKYREVMEMYLISDLPLPAVVMNYSADFIRGLRDDHDTMAYEDPAKFRDLYFERSLKTAKKFGLNPANLLAVKAQLDEQPTATALR